MKCGKSRIAHQLEIAISFWRSKLRHTRCGWGDLEKWGRHALYIHTQRNALHLVEWAVRYCQSHGTTWSLEQVGSVAVCELLHEMGVAFDVFHFQDLGVPQTRRRVIAGSLEIVQALRDRAGQSRRPLSVQDVIPNCRGSHVKNATTSTWQVRGGARVQIPLTRDHPSFARPVSQPAYTVTGSSPLRWYTPDAEGCTMFSPFELMLVQGFPASYKLHQRHARVTYAHRVEGPKNAPICLVTEITFTPTDCRSWCTP